MPATAVQTLCSLCCENLARWFDELSAEAREDKIQLPDEFTLMCSHCGNASFVVGAPIESGPLCTACGKGESFWEHMFRNGHPFAPSQEETE